MIKILNIDELTSICGYFNSQTMANNGYGCNHKDCEDKVIVDGEGCVISDEEFERKVWEQIYKNIDKSVEVAIEKIKTYPTLKKVVKQIYEDRYSKKMLKKLGLKLQGRCFTFSCPLACSADLEDLKEHDQELYEDCKDDENIESYDYMVVDMSQFEKIIL